MSSPFTKELHHEHLPHISSFPKLVVCEYWIRFTFAQTRPQKPEAKL